MLNLVELAYQVEISPITQASFDALAKSAPLDGLQDFLLRHVRCVSGRPDALEIDPPSAPDGAGVRGRCLHCGAEDALAVEVGATSREVVHYWLVLGAAMVAQHPDLFGRDGAFDSEHRERYRRCTDALERTVHRCAILSLNTAVTH